MIGLLAPPASYATRYALVIGNSNYDPSIGALKNPVNDAKDMSALLKRKDFKVTTLTNANQREMKDSITKFTKQLNEKNAVGLFFYAGHGIEVDGRNYLIPLNANINGEGDVQYETVDAGRVMSGMEYAGNNLNMVILDACRNNPFARSFRSASRGLAKMDPPKGSLILYATSPGDVAADGSGRNGMFTQHLLKAIDTPGFTVEKVFKATANQVYKTTNKKQLPWQSGVMLGDFYFTINAPQASTVTINSPASNSNQAEIVFWESIKKETAPDFFRTYLQQYPQGIYAQLAKLKIQRDGTIIDEEALQQATVEKVSFRIKTSPENAKIRILNITPKYQHGIKLKPGRYQIEVIHEGYQRYLKWIDLKNEDTVYSVILEEQQQVDFIRPSVQASHNRISSPTITDNYSGVKMVSVPAGCFQMGSNTGGSDEQPVHRVCLSTYDIGKYEVTQALWQKVMGNNPSSFKGSNKPVEKVSWDDIQDFIRKLNQETGQKFRLPTEAEWEYACRSGGRDQKYCGGNNVNSVAWSKNNSGDTTHNVGQKQANGLGLYDMNGNVWEWVQDRYDESYYSSSPTNNPKGPSGGSYHVGRGGGWFDDASYLGSAVRGSNSPEVGDDDLGFRLAITR